MRAPKFCCECGEPVKAGGGSFWPARVFCGNCSPRFRWTRLVLVAALALCAAGGFIAGRYSRPRGPFQFIGAPVDPHTRRVLSPVEQNGAAPATGNNPAQPNREAVATGAAETLCGAPTKSGRPCRRTVRGGGYCYQHRGKASPRQARQSG